MYTYHVQVIIGDYFEDLYIKASSGEVAIRKARRTSSLRTHMSYRWARFVI